MARRTHLLAPEQAPLSIEAAKADFGRRLQIELAKRGWNQSDLWRRYNDVARARGQTKIHRSNISNYIRGLFLPTPIALKTLAEALGMEPLDLLPAGSRKETSASVPPFSLDTVDGKAWVRINMSLPWEAAIRIQEIIASALRADAKEINNADKE